MIFSAVFADCHSCHLCALLCHRDTTVSPIDQSNDFAFDIGTSARSGRARARGMLADAVASAVLRRYASLPKHGKPQPGEYTLLAGFAVTDDAVPVAPPRVVALGTGTKCLPASSRCPRGEARTFLAHAEVIARRAFVRFLYDELERAASDDGDGETKRDATDANASTRSVPIVEWIATHDDDDDAAVRLRAAFASTCTPRASPPVRRRLDIRSHGCARDRERGAGGRRDGGRRDAEGALSGCAFSRGKRESKKARRQQTRQDVERRVRLRLRRGFVRFFGCDGRQGVRIVRGVRSREQRGASRRRRARVAGQRLGACRLKPGRGAQTDCMSCSDKIARWVALGVQGALPSSLISRTATLSDRSDHLESSQVSQLTGSDVETYGAVRLASVVVASPPSSEYREECENNDFGRSRGAPFSTRFAERSWTASGFASRRATCPACSSRAPRPPS